MGKIYFETTDSKIIEMYEDYLFLKFYEKEVIEDLKNLAFYNENDYNDILLNHLNKHLLKLYMDILMKYKQNSFNFHSGEWYLMYLDLAQTNERYIYHIFDTPYISLTLGYLKYEIIDFYKKM